MNDNLSAMDYSVAANHGHVPVMRDRMAELLVPGVEKLGAKAVLIDATLGAGGHTEHFLRAFPDAHVIGVDRDPNALAQASERLAPFGDRFAPVQARFDDMGAAIAGAAGPAFDLVREVGVAGALFDLGVSSMQLDQEERGFAYRVDAPLDMRMDPSHGITAADVLNTYSHGDLARVLKTYGDERFAGKIASRCLRSVSEGRSPPAPDWWSCCTTRFRRRPAAPVATRQSAPSRHFASRSTESWTRSAA